MSGAALQSYSQEKVFWKYAAYLQENTHGEHKPCSADNYTRAITKYI